MFKIRVPATSANLGPGFDCLGMAVNCYNTFLFSPSKTIEQPDHLVIQSYLHTCRQAGQTARPLRVEVEGHIPMARGLGSSAACVTAGVLAAEQMLEVSFTPSQRLEFATQMEGHPDNVAPALLGGIVCSAFQQGRVLSCSVPVKETISLLVLIPDQPLSTQAARAVLPKQVAFADAVFNSAHVGLLISALCSGRDDLLQEAFRDRLHQPYRSSLIPGFDGILEHAYSLGAKGAFLSGAGSSIMLVSPALAVADGMREFLQNHPWQWELRPLAVDQQGAVFLA